MPGILTEQRRIVNHSGLLRTDRSRPGVRWAAAERAPQADRRPGERPRRGIVVGLTSVTTASGLFHDGDGGCDGFVIPTIPDYLSTNGIPQIRNRAGAFAENIGETIEPLGVIISKYREQSSLHTRAIPAMPISRRRSVGRRPLGREPDDGLVGEVDRWTRVAPPGRASSPRLRRRTLVVPWTPRHGGRTHPSCFLM